MQKTLEQKFLATAWMWVWHDFEWIQKLQWVVRC